MKKKFRLQEWLPDQETKLTQPEVTEKASMGFNSSLPDDETLETAIRAIELTQTDITPDYESWRNIGFALAEEYGESGREAFQRISRFHPKYDSRECDEQFTRCLKAKGSGVTMGTFYHYLKSSGIRLSDYSEKPSSTFTNPTKPDIHHGNQTSYPQNQFNHPENMEIDPEEEEEEEEMPLFPDSIFDDLPLFLQKVVQPASSREERDMLLLGTLTTVSACFPKLTGIYDDKKVWANLYLFVTAPASAGKGRLSLCKLLVLPIHKIMREHAKALKLKYANDLADFNMDKSGSKEKPGKPPERMLFIPANNSKTGVFQLLSDNKGRGLIFENESDTIATAFKSEHGNFSDGLRNAWHHETISYYRRTDREYVDIEYPSLSVVLSGTPKQIPLLIPSAENGLFSRFLFYYLNLKPVWKKVFKRTSTEGVDNYYLALGEEFFELYKTLNQHNEIQVTVTEEQAEVFDEIFEGFQTRYLSIQNEEYLASIRRMGLAAYRMIMIFTALRIMEDGYFDREMQCQERDFKAVIEIARVLIKHSSKIFTYLPEEPGPQKRKNQAEKFLDALPAEFSRQDYIQIAIDLKMEPKSVERYITNFVKSKMINRVKPGFYEFPAKQGKA